MATPLSDKPFEDMGYLIAFGIIICFAWPRIGLAVIAAALAGIIIIAVSRTFDEGRRERAEHDAELVRRADRQHAAALRGDPYGLYGEYPPPKEPVGLSSPVCDERYARYHAQLRRQLSYSHR